MRQATAFKHIVDTFHRKGIDSALCYHDFPVGIGHATLSAACNAGHIYTHKHFNATLYKLTPKAKAELTAIPK